MPAGEKVTWSSVGFRRVASTLGRLKGETMEIGARRPIGGTGWNVWRAVIGVFYLAAAGFNLTYTLPKTNEAGLLDGYADGAWFGFLETFMRDALMPNDTLLMAAVIVFEVLVGWAILSAGQRVDLGVALSLAWVVAILPFLAWPYLLTNLVLIVMQGVLLFRRFDTPIWTLLGDALGGGGRPHAIH